VPRAGLTRERVVAEAAAVAHEAGLARLTLATVAKRLGVSLPGLYKHIDGLDALRRDLAVRGVHQLTAAMSAAAVGRAGPAALHAMACAYRDYAAASPALCAASIRAPDPADAEHLAAAEAAVAVVRSALSGYQLGADDMVHAVRCFRVALHGFVTLDAGGGFGMPQSVDTTFTRLVDSLDTAFRAWTAAPPG
jgi:AcrR family transcriptional regulator